MNKGKLIVIDGTDGSGKHTQTVLLAKALKAQGYKVKDFSFPQYEKKFGNFKVANHKHTHYIVIEK